jgi:hypothetical protein
MRSTHVAALLGAVLCYEAACGAGVARGQVVISGTVKDLEGNPLTTAQLNALRVNQTPLTDAEYKARMNVSAVPRGRTGVTGTFDPTNAKFEVRLDPGSFNAKDKRVALLLSAGALLDPVNLDGLALEDQKVINVSMPLGTPCGECWQVCGPPVTERCCRATVSRHGRRWR